MWLVRNITHMVMAPNYLMLDKRTNGKNPQKWATSVKCPHPSPQPVYLSWIVKQPLLSGFVLIGRDRLGHLMSNCGAHGVQDPVQPHLHLTHTKKHKKTQERAMNTNAGKHCNVSHVSTDGLSYQWTLMRSLISIRVEVKSGKYYGM